MHPIETAIEGYQQSLCKEIDLLALINRNPIAHKWKVTYQSICLRETVAWRFTDLIKQSWLLHENKQVLGSRILLRSAIETVAMLIYLNQLTESVIAENISFPSFMEKVINLFSGSRDGSTDQKATNIVTVLQKCEKTHPGIERTYGFFSESAHPNYEGMRICYSETSLETKVTTFSNRTAYLYSAMQEDGITMAMGLFESEYNEIWAKNFEELESWLVKNESHLEAYKSNGI